VTPPGRSIFAIQASASSGNIGVDTFTGPFTALLNVRDAARVISGIAVAATVGVGATVAFACAYGCDRAKYRRLFRCDELLP
jgi:ABC-type transporter Mla maintaining outer membrane lipid asymmetry permease subunit MlaE